MSEPVMLKTQTEVMDLDTFDEIKIFKQVPFTNAESTADALARVGGDTAKFLAIINEGLKGEALRSAREDSNIPWMQAQEDGTIVPYTGKPADMEKVAPLVLNLAKTLFSDDYVQGGEKRKLAKEAAKQFIKANEPIRAKLQATA